MTRTVAVKMFLIVAVTIAACRTRQDDVRGGGSPAPVAPVVAATVQQPMVAVPAAPPAPVAPADTAKERPIRLAPPVGLAELADIGKALGKPFREPVDAQVGRPRVPRQLKNCRDFLAVVDMAPTAETESAWDDLNDYGVHCVALELLRTARPARTSFIDKFHLGKDSVAKLPVDFNVGIADEAIERIAAAAAKGLRWRDMGGAKKVKVTDNTTIQVDTDYDLTTLFEYARADFDGDGVEDILVRRDYVIHRGRYRSYNLLIVTRTDAKARLKVIRTLSPTE